MREAARRHRERHRRARAARGRRRGRTESSRTLIVAHDKLLTARTLRLAGLPHPHTTLLSPALPDRRPGAPGRAQAAVRQLGTRRRAVLDGGGAGRGARPAAAEAVVPRARSARPGARGAAGLGPALVVAGGRVVGAACRIARGGEWRTNAALGAQVEPVEPPPIAQALALAVVRAARVGPRRRRPPADPERRLPRPRAERRGRLPSGCTRLDATCSRTRWPRCSNDGVQQSELAAASV